MNVIDRLQLIKRVIETPEIARRISNVAANEVIADYKERIFVFGEDSNNNQIGTYSTNPFYINPLTLIGVAADDVKPLEGKTGKKVFASGKKHVTKYLPQGYKQLRELTDRGSQKVDLNFSGSMFLSIKIENDGLNAVIRFTDDRSAQIMEAQEIRFGKTISEPTELERKKGAETASNELRIILDELATI